MCVRDVRCELSIFASDHDVHDPILVGVLDHHRRLEAIDREIGLLVGGQRGLFGLGEELPNELVLHDRLLDQREARHHLALLLVVIESAGGQAEHPGLPLTQQVCDARFDLHRSAGLVDPREAIRVDDGAGNRERDQGK